MATNQQKTRTMPETTDSKQDASKASDISPLLADEREYSNDLAKDLCELQDALGFPCEVEDCQKKSMERIRDLIAKEGELGDLYDRVQALKDLRDKGYDDREMEEAIRNL